MFRWYLQQHLRDHSHLQWLAKREFLRAIRTGRVIAFVGSYATQELDYREWRAFLKEAAKQLMVGRGTPPPSIANAKQEIMARGSNPTLMFDLIEEWVIANERERKEDAVREAIRRDIAEKQFGLRDCLPDRIAASSPFHIAESLGIDRVITTNYDLEFEWLWMTTSDEKLFAGANRQRLFEKLCKPQGSRQPVIDKDDAGSLIRKLPGGRSAISDVFYRGRPDRLIEFAVGSPDYEAHVMHLHGRATDAKTLVVSLRDYQDQYRRSGITKLPFEHAQRMLFAGNPVIFVGLGMNEDLITATLEQFVSDHPARQLAPAFVIWSPELKKGAPVEGSELLRLSWYRRFGVLTLFDCDLPTYRRGPKKLRVARSLKSLGEFARNGIRPFDWQAPQFRSMQKRMDAAGTGNRHDVWQRKERPKDLPYDFFDGAAPSPIDPAKPGIDGLCDGDVFGALFRGAPIKAFIDRPGTGHGYLAKVIADAFATQVNKVSRTECAIVNANFICEVDSAFALLSGLYDRKTAFSEGKSRGQALVEYQAEVLEGLLDSGLTASVLVVISGMDRFFDTSGYPLSNELDMTVRRLAPLYRLKLPDPDWVPQPNVDRALQTPDHVTLHGLIARRGMVNPYSIVLLGTSRVQRYLEGLGLRRQVDGSAQIGDYEILNDRAFANGNSFREEIIQRYRAGLRRLAQPLPIEPRRRDQIDSAYLRSIVSAFDARAVIQEGLSTSRRGLIDHARDRRAGSQRHSFLGAYLRSGTIMAALPKRKKRLADLCLDILSTMAFIGQPIEQEALERAPRVVRRLNGFKRTDVLADAVDQLLRLNLVIEFQPFPQSPPNWRRLGLHRAVMAELRDRYGVPISDAKLSGGFNLSLFASQPVDDYTPEEDMHKELGGLIDAMLEAVEEDKTGLDPRSSVWLRAAQSVMRSYFTTAALLTHKPPEGAQEEPSAPLTDHARRLEHLIRLAEETAEARTARKSAHPGVDLGPEALFPDDLVWLHNELGVVKLAQGDLYEARQALDRALTINTNHVEYADRLQNWRRIQLNQVQVDFERAKIGRAQSRILEIEQSINEQAEALFELTDHVPRLFGANFVDDIICRFGREPLPQTRVVDDKYPADLILSTGLVTGYRALCSHVQGEIETASHYFRDAVEIFRNIGEQRAYALFQRHRASLLFGIDKLPDCEASMNLCVAAANSSRQLDIAHLASITAAEHQIGIAPAIDDVPILPRMMESLRYAASADMYRVRMEVQRALARLRSATGDYDGALEHATEAMSVATRYGFTLRKISLRILIGEILIRRGDKVSGNALIERAIRNADRVGFGRAVQLSHQVRVKYNQLISA